MFSKDAHVKDTIKASVAIAVCLAVLGAFVVVLGGYRFWENLTVYYIRFYNVKDLSAGRPVKYGGLDVGRILGIGVDEQDPRMIKVTVGLTADVAIRQGVVARIAQKGLVGDYYVFLEPRGTLGEPLPGGAVIPSIESVDLTQLAGLAGEILSELRPKLDRIATNLEEIFTSENSERITRVLEKAPNLIDDLSRAASQFRTDFAKLADGGRNAEDKAAKALDALNTAVDQVRGELIKTLVEVRGEVKQASGLTDTLHKAVRQDQAQLENILENLDRLSQDLKYLASRLRERPWEVFSQPVERKR